MRRNGASADDNEKKQISKKITKKFRGKEMKYLYVQTVKSMEELNKFRFKHYCTKTLRNFGKSIVLPCGRKAKRKGCAFELLAVRPNAKSAIIHVYAHSHHNHALLSEDERSICGNVKVLMRDANPPMVYRMGNIEFKFLQTVPDYVQTRKFSLKNHVHYPTWNENFWRVRAPCIRKWSHKCEFKLLAMKSTKHRYHVYQHSEHNHPPIKSKKSVSINLAKKRAAGGHQQEQQQMEDEGEDEEGDSEDVDDIEEQGPIIEQQHPPRKIGKNIMYQKREYYYQKTLKSIREFHQFRVENKCCFNDAYIMPCTEEMNGRKCGFELMALAPDLANGTIQVYAHSRHNHPIQSNEKTSTNEMVPDDKPPTIEPNIIQQKPMEGEEGRGGKDGEEDVPMSTMEAQKLVDEPMEQEVEKEEESGGDEGHGIESIEEEEEQEDKAIEEELEENQENEEDEEDDDIIIIEEEEVPINEREDEAIKQEVKEEIMEIEIIEENPREETLQEKWEKDNKKAYKWMAGIGPTEIEGAIGDCDKMFLVKMVEMADQEIQEYPQKINWWLPWLKCAIPKCLPQIILEGFYVRFKDLIKLAFE